MHGSSAEDLLVLFLALAAATLAAVASLYENGRPGALLRHAVALLLDQILQADRIKIVDHDTIQARPKVMGHAPLIVVAAVFLAAALRGVQRLVHRIDDVGNRNVRHRAGERIATARAT